MLEVFVKDPTVDPTCGASFLAENQQAFVSTRPVVIGALTGHDTSFNVPFKITFANPGQRVLICAYTEWVTDTAAVAQLEITVAGGDTPPPSTGSAPPSASTAPSSTGTAATPPAATNTGSSATGSAGSGSAIAGPRPTRPVHHHKHRHPTHHRKHRR